MRSLQAFLLIGAFAAVAAGCARSARVTSPETDFLEVLRSRPNNRELIRHLSGDDPSGGGRAKKLVWESFISDDSNWENPEHIRVFADPACCWPGINPLTIVYTDGSKQVRAWLTRNEEPIFVMAHLKTKDGLPHELRIFSRNRWGGGTHVDDYRVTPTEIRRIRAEVHTDLDMGRLVRE